MGRVKKLKKLLRQREVVGNLTGEVVENKEHVEVVDIKDGKYDAANPLIVIPGKTDDVKQNERKTKSTLKLSKKKRKQLLKILERKKKKQNRDEILSQLSQLQTEATKTRKKIAAKVVDIKQLRKRKAPVQAWGKNAVKEIVKRADVLGLEESSEEEDEDTGMEDESDESSEEEGGQSKRQKPETPQAQKDLTNDEIMQIAREKLKQLKGTRERSKSPPVDKKVGHLQPNKTEAVILHRPEEVKEHRSKLPIISMEQEIMETISTNPVTVICGETGSGKTTQVVQFLYECGYAEKAMIGITEPRRVAAISMSKRVGYEMGLTEDVVSYQVRFEGNATEQTKVKFLTDGVLLKEMEKDLSLQKYSVIIIDEAHERSIHSDVAVGLLSRIVTLREKQGNPLRIVIMSATLRIADFTENKKLFKNPPPVIKVNARQFPVTIHFNRTTPKDYMADVDKKVNKIHQSLPPGGILVFLTGRQEVNSLVRKLRERYPTIVGEKSKAVDEATSHKRDVVKREKTPEDKSKKDPSAESEDQPEMEDSEAKTVIEADKITSVAEGGLDLNNYSVCPLEDGQLEDAVEEIPKLEDASDDEMLDVDNSDEELEEELVRPGNELPKEDHSPMRVLPLFAMLPTSEQQRVFQSTPEDVRLCVVATNVAETSLTIPGIRYVVDCGKSKTRVYDRVTGISKFVITWASKASAEQRAGRAGRQGPGHCYRLYSSAIYNDDFIDFSPAEVTLRPVEALLLQMKCMGIEKVVNFPFPSPPCRDALVAAENSLCEMGALVRDRVKPLALRERENWMYSSVPTPLGRAMSCFPVAPRFSKMLALSHQQPNLMAYVVALVAGLAIQEPFIPGSQGKCPISCKAMGDMGRLLAAVGAAEYENRAETHGLRHAAFREIRKLRHQLTGELNLLIPDLKLIVDPQMAPPTGKQLMALRQLSLCAMSDRVARRKHGKIYESMQTEGHVYLHSESVVYKNQPSMVVYHEITEQDNDKMYLRMVCPIEEHWLPLLANGHCVLSDPLADPSPEYDDQADSLMVWVDGTFGALAWPLPKTKLKAPDTWCDRFAFFGKFLLEGKVVESFKKFGKCYTSKTDILIKKYASVSPKASMLINALKKENVYTKQRLLQKWKENSNFLMTAMLEWVQEEHHGKIKLKWPPLDLK